MSTKTKKRKRKLDLSKVKRLSTLLAIGLRDLRKQERAKNSVVNMGKWLEYNGKCQACLAGSVMRWSCKAGPTFDEAKVPQRVFDRMSALNDLRRGLVSDAAFDMGIETIVRNRLVVDYETNRDAWFADMRQLLRDLRSAGE